MKKLVVFAVLAAIVARILPMVWDGCRSEDIVRFRV